MRGYVSLHCKVESNGKINVNFEMDVMTHVRRAAKMLEARQLFCNRAT